MLHTYEELLDYISNLTIIDSHEHLPVREELRDQNADIFSEYLLQYFSTDLITAGLPPQDYQKLLEHQLNISEKWALLKPFWKYARHTGYGQCIETIARDIYGIAVINDESVEEWNHKFKQELGIGHFQKILKETCKIKASILDFVDMDVECNPDPDYFVPSHRIDLMLYPKTGKDLRTLSQQSGVTICSFESYLAACESIMQKYMHKSKLLKCGVAYERGLHFERVTRQQAESGFQAVFAANYYFQSKDEQMFTVGKPFQDYIMHFLLEIAQRNGMVLQMHSGIQEGNGNFLRNSRPSLLNNLFLEYPGIAFDVFHIGYPYQNELLSLAKMFPNVYIDMCWSHIVSPVAAQNALSEFLEAIPYNKICGFGGDFLFVDGVYGHLCVARQNIAKVLATKTQQGLFDIDEAKFVAQTLLYDAPAKLYGIR